MNTNTGTDTLAVARDLHRCYCAKYANIPFDIFEDDFIAAAELAMQQNVPPTEFVRMLSISTDGNDWVDPEDLRSICRNDIDNYSRNRMLEVHYQHQCDQKHLDEVCARRELTLPQVVDHFRMTSRDYTDTFRITQAIDLHKKHVTTDEDLAAVIQKHGETAIGELRISQPLQEHISQCGPMSAGEVIRVIEETLAALMGERSDAK